MPLFAGEIRVPWERMWPDGTDSHTCSFRTMTPSQMWEKQRVAESHLESSFFCHSEFRHHPMGVSIHGHPGTSLWRAWRALAQSSHVLTCRCVDWSLLLFWRLHRFSISSRICHLFSPGGFSPLSHWLHDFEEHGGHRTLKTALRI